MTAREVFAALAARFPEEQVKTRLAGGGRKLSYITARTARHRLNEVVGPENWSCSVEPSEHWVKCTITIMLPDGKQVRREAIGGYPDMPSQEDRVKGGDSDSFKRACVLFGIGEYLYGDDVSDHEEPRQGGRSAARSDQEVPPSKQQVSAWYDKSSDARGRQESGRQGRGWPKHGRQLFAWLKDIEKDYAWPSVIAQVNENFGPKSNYMFPSKITDWDEDQSDAAATFVAHRCAETKGYNGEFEEHIGVKR